MGHMIGDVKICVEWKNLPLVVTIEEADYYEPDEYMPTSGYLELDVMEKHWTPALRMIQAMFDDEPDRYFQLVVDGCADEVYEKGLDAHAAMQVALDEYAAEAYAAAIYEYRKAGRRGEW